MRSNKEVMIDESIRPYLNEIAERLWSTPSHAAIMVGSGFSKNANKDFPCWTTLADIFYEKIHGSKPDKNKGENRYLNALKLADEVQAAFGRPALAQLLRSNIPDKDSQPSTLHYKLLEFPWSDVFTTNYDTLLERASNSVSSQKFDTVVNKEDLVYSEKPRIIKLHGSFPSERPFIITEEDYRTYPKVFAPFVNTVQQSLLENTLCLIGFSGNDPNFLRWIGWIRDNLGKANSPKIYLVGAFNLSEAQKKLLEQRNIVLIDFSKCFDVERSHYKAMERFFDYLLSRRKEDSRLDWPDNHKKMYPDSKATKVSQLKEIIKEWRQIRLNFPGWVVVPEDLREILWTFTNNWVTYISVKDEFPDQLDLFFSFELNWRLERCLCPILNSISELFEAVIEKYWPFKETCPEQSIVRLSEKKYQKLDWKEIRNMWLNLSLSLLRFYREEGMFRSWEDFNKKIDDLIKYLPQDKKAFLHYERVLYALFKMDIPKVKSELSSWPTNFSIPFWESRRAGLLAEIGQTEEAERVLERSLQEIRSKLNLKHVTTNYSLVSEEATLMVLAKYIKNANNFSSNFPKATSEEVEKMKKENLDSKKQSRNDSREDSKFISRNEGDSEEEWNNLFSKRNNETKSEWNRLLRNIRRSQIEKLSKSFQERWNSLKQYKCDPWNEIKLFEKQLERPPVPRVPVSKKNEFDIGRVTRTYHTHVWDQEAMIACNFLRYFEDSGFPYRIPHSTLGKKSAEGALQRLSKYSPYWSMATLIRIGDAEVTDRIFNRQTLLKYNVDEIDNLIDMYLEALRLVESGKVDVDGFYVDNYDVLLAQIVPEILSRLCCKCSKDKKLLLFDFLRNAYGCDYKNIYRGIQTLFKRLLKTFSVEEKYQLLPRLVEIPFPENTSRITEHEFVNPFHLIEIEKDYIYSIKKVNINENSVKVLFDLASSDSEEKRRWGALSLVQLYRLELLKRHHEKILGRILWSRTNNGGFPEFTDYYNFAFLDVPHPKNIDPTALIKDYIKNTNFPIQAHKSKRGISITHGNIRLCNEIIGASKIVNWSKEEIDNLLKRLVQWWNADKNHLTRDDASSLFVSLSEEFKKRFSRLKDVLVEVVLPALNNDLASASKIQKNVVKKLVHEFSEHGFTTVRVKAAGLPLLQSGEGVLLTEIENALGSNAHEEVVDGLNALLLLLKNDSFIQTESIKKPLMALGQKILWRHQVGLVSGLNVVRIISKDYPQHLGSELESACLHGLGALVLETDLDQIIDESEFLKRLEVREAAARLANQLHKVYKRRESSIPEQVLQWKEICTKQEEFAEIKIQWKTLTDKLKDQEDGTV